MYLALLFTGKEEVMGTILLIIVVVVLLGGVYPAWPHSANWGYYPFGGVLGLVLLILLVLFLMGRLH